MVIAYYLLGYVIPLSILVITTYKLIKSLKELQDRKKEMTSSSKGGKDEVTMSLIIVVIVFTLCQLTNPVSTTIPGSECLFRNHKEFTKFMMSVKEKAGYGTLLMAHTHYMGTGQGQEKETGWVQ